MLTEPRFYTDVLDALDTVTAIGLGKENSGVRTAEAYLRSRQSADGLWYPGPPPNKADALAAAAAAKAPSRRRDRQGHRGRHLADAPGAGRPTPPSG